MADFLGAGGAGTHPMVGPMPFAGPGGLLGGALSAAAPAPSFGASDAPSAVALHDPEEEILRRFHTLQRVRKAAGQAAQIADIDAAELRRLEAHAAAALQQAGVPQETLNRVRQPQQHRPKEEAQEEAAQPAAGPPAPAPAAAAPPRSEEELRERAGRVMELGNFWAAQKRGDTAADAAADAAAAVTAAAREAGSFPALAAALRARLVAAPAAKAEEVARAAPQGPDPSAAAGAGAAAYGGGAAGGQRSPTSSAPITIS